MPRPIVARGPEAVAAALAAVNDPAVRYVVLDALSEQDLLTQGVALREMKLVSGGSGLAIGLARDWAQRHGARGEKRSGRHAASRPGGGALGLLLGDDQQPVAAYRQQAPARAVDLSACFTDLESYVRTLTDWVDAQRDAPLAPMIYATTEPQTLQRIRGAVWRQGQQRTGGTAVCRSCRRPEGERIYPLYCGRRGNVEHCGADPRGLRRSILGRPSPPGVPSGA